MRLVLSRKGFDSTSGGCASPILPDGRLLTLPIPSAGGLVRYCDLTHETIDIGQLVHDLTRGKVAPGTTAHLDPDLSEGIMPRAKGWRPAFGQVDAAQVHLSNQQVGSGDLFMFFGWFREVGKEGGRWRFRRGAPDLHVLFGWLQVGEVIDVAVGRDEALMRHPWLRSHPHLSSAAAPNVVYVAADRVLHAGFPDGRLPGAGIFPRLHQDLVLTCPGQRLRSRWRLPKCFSPREGRPPLTYHEKLERWTPEKDAVGLRSVARGQEFVLDLTACPDAETWAINTAMKHGA